MNLHDLELSICGYKEDLATQEATPEVYILSEL